ncbi:hypothetical protein [Methylobacter svalbardensis]|uniref:hypothetical protein n=1 Tax=Methylobacter svalbardensis TaxID=3080016 RepID=UPI0030EBBF72
MSDKISYQTENGCFVIHHSESNTEIQLCNFTAKIIKEEKLIHEDGTSEVFVHIDGKTKDGIILNRVRLSMAEFDKPSWFRKSWGSVVQLNQHGVKNASTHLPLAIRANSLDSICYESVYGKTGLVFDKQNSPIFLFNNGAVTSTGVDPNYRASLPDEINFYSLEENVLSKADLNSEIKEVLGLLDLSDKNPYIGTLLCLAAFRADISIWLPVDFWFFLIGGKKSSTNKIAKVIQSFFGSFQKESVLLPWASSPTKLDDLAKAATNTVFTVSNFEYPSDSKRLPEYIKKANDFFLKIHSRTSRLCHR